MDQQALEAVLLEQIERLEQTTESRHQSVGGSGSILSANDTFIAPAMLPMGPLHVAQQESTGFDADAFPIDAVALRFAPAPPFPSSFQYATSAQRAQPQLLQPHHLAPHAAPPINPMPTPVLPAVSMPLGAPGHLQMNDWFPNPGFIEPEPLREQERLLPMANVAKLMAKQLPPTAKISREAKVLMQEMASEFICFIAAEASDLSLQANQQAITPDQIIESLDKLDFSIFVPCMEEAKSLLPQKGSKQASKQAPKQARDAGV